MFVDMMKNPSDHKEMHSSRTSSRHPDPSYHPQGNVFHPLLKVHSRVPLMLVVCMDRWDWNSLQIWLGRRLGLSCYLGQTILVFFRWLVLQLLYPSSLRRSEIPVVTSVAICELSLIKSLLCFLLFGINVAALHAIVLVAVTSLVTTCRQLTAI